MGRAAGMEFRGLVNTAIGVLVLSGVILSVSRLTSPAVSLPYVLVLAGKIVVALYMFTVTWFMGRRDAERQPTVERGRMRRLRDAFVDPVAVMAGGIVAIGLADVLDALFEQGLAE